MAVTYDKLSWCSFLNTEYLFRCRRRRESDYPAKVYIPYISDSNELDHTVFLTVKLSNQNFESRSG